MGQIKRLRDRETEAGRQAGRQAGLPACQYKFVTIRVHSELRRKKRLLVEFG
jgi:hypothetical protein